MPASHRAMPGPVDGTSWFPGNGGEQRGWSCSRDLGGGLCKCGGVNHMQAHAGSANCKLLSIIIRFLDGTGGRCARAIYCMEQSVPKK